MEAATPPTVLGGPSWGPLKTLRSGDSDAPTGWVPLPRTRPHPVPSPPMAPPLLPPGSPRCPALRVGPRLFPSVLGPFRRYSALLLNISSFRQSLAPSWTLGHFRHHSALFVINIRPFSDSPSFPSPFGSFRTRSDLLLAPRPSPSIYSTWDTLHLVQQHSVLSVPPRLLAWIQESPRTRSTIVFPQK